MFDNIEWTLIAEDKASGTFKKVALSAKELSSASEGMTESVNKSNSSWQNIAKGVFAGGIALGAAKQAFSLLSGEIGRSIQEASDFQREQAQLTSVLNSTGHAAGLTRDELNQMSDDLSSRTAIAQGDITNVQSMLLTFTKVGEAQFGTVTQAVLDLATTMNSGGVPSMEALKGTAIQLGKAMNDPIQGVSALAKAGVQLSDEQKALIESFMETNDIASAQQVILDELATQTGGAASAAAQTYEGRMASLKNAMNDVREQVGMALMPTLTLFAETMVDQTGKVKLSEAGLYKWQKAIYVVGLFVKGAIMTIGNLGKGVFQLARVFWESVQVMLGVAGDLGRSFANLGDNFKMLFKAVKQGLTGDFDGALSTLKSGFASVFSESTAAFGNMGKALGDLLGTLESAGDPMADAMQAAMNPEAFNKVVDGMKQAENATNGLGNAMSDLGGGGDGSVSDAQKKIQEAMDKLTTDYTGAREKINTALMQLEEDHGTNVGKIKDKLADLRTSLEETTSAYQKSMGEMNKSEAERVVEQEQTIADLQSQIEQIRNGAGAEGLQPQDQTQIDTLQAQLDKEKAAYDVYISERQGLDTELTEARRRSQLTEFERFVEDINAKRTEEQAAYDAKLALIAGETLAQQTALAEENLIYETKKAMYAEVDAAFQAFHDKYLANMGDMRNYTSESVAVMAAELKRISDLFAEIQSLRSSAGLAGVSLGSPSDAAASSQEGTTDNSSVTTQVTNNITVQVTGDANAAAATVAEIQRQLELANLGST